MGISAYIGEMWQLASQRQLQGIWFWAALYAFFVCGYSIIFQIKTRYWPSVEGELVKAQVEKFGATDLVKSDQDYISKALYSYSVAGREYEGKRISPWVFVASHNARFVLQKQLGTIDRLPNDKVRVYYNPKKPHKSYLVVAGRLGISLTILFCTLPMLLYYFRFYY